MHAPVGCAETIFTVTKMARETQPQKKVFHKEEFALRLVPFMGFCYNLNNASASIMSQMEKLSGTRGFIHTKNSLGFYLRGSNDERCAPTFLGDPSKLLAVLNIAIALNEQRKQKGGGPFFDESKCSLRIAAPSLQTVKRLVSAASTNLTQNPGSFGVDPDANCYFAVKTLTDMRTLMHGIVNGKEAKCIKTFNVEWLDYPKGVF